VLSIRSLHASVGGKEILRGIDLDVKAGEVHAVMGPNGSGKSTLAQVLAGHPAYAVTEGEVRYEGRNLLEMPPEERAREGVFLAFQYPVEIPGVSNAAFLKAAVNEMRTHRGLEELDAMEFLQLVDQKLRLVEMDRDFLTRPVNEGFSGGEKKRNEMLQLAVLEPKLAILDETDSGLDIDALRIVAEGINRLRNPRNAIILVTHYQRILNYVEPDHVHVLLDGRVVRSGGKSLAVELEARGYDWIRDETRPRTSGATAAAVPDDGAADPAATTDGADGSLREHRGRAHGGDGPDTSRRSALGAGARNRRRSPPDERRARRRATGTDR
jgi:Fe-S cluster assembly ATP-binding protein